MTKVKTDIDLIEMIFVEIMDKLGYDEWYDCDSEWGKIASIMIKMGLDKKMVLNYFEELAWDL